MTRFTAILMLLFVFSVALAEGGLIIDEWRVPYENSRPRDPFVDSSGKVWFCGQAGRYIAWFDPEQEKFGKFDLADGAGPHNLIIDDKDRIWFAANTRPYIGRLDGTTGEVVKFPMPVGLAKDPHTLVFDGTGHIWFTAQWANAVGRLDMNTGEVNVIEVPEPDSRPYGIKVDDRGRPWVVLFGTHYLATIDPVTLELETIELPRFEARPRRLEILQGVIWYGDYAAGFLGRYDPILQQFSEWPLPGGERARPYGMASDGRSNLFVAEGGSPNRVVRFDVSTKTFAEITPAPNSRGSIRHMYYHAPSGDIWFGEDSNFISRIKGARP